MHGTVVGWRKVLVERSPFAARFAVPRGPQNRGALSAKSHAGTGQTVTVPTLKRTTTRYLWPPTASGRKAHQMGLIL